MPNAPLQARAGQNAPFPWGSNVHTRGLVLGPVPLTGTASDQLLIEAVDEPIFLAPAAGGGAPSIGAFVGTSAAPVAGDVFLVDALGNDVAIANVTLTDNTLTDALVTFLTAAGGFLLAPGEKLVFRATMAVPTGAGVFYPNAGYIPKDPSELKPYRINLSDGAKHLIAEAPPGKALVCVPYPVTGGGAGYGVVLSTEPPGAAALVFFLDGNEISTQAFGAIAPGSDYSINAPAFAAGIAVVIPAGSKLEAQVTGAAAASVTVAALSLRMENGS